MNRETNLQAGWGGSVPCQGNYTQLLKGEKPPRGRRVSSSPSSKGGLETFLSPKRLHMPDSAFQKSIELLKTLMKTGNVVSIRGVFFQSPPGSAVTQKEPNAGMNHLAYHHHHPWRSHVGRATPQEVWGTTWERGGTDSSGVSGQTPPPWWEQRRGGSLIVPVRLSLSQPQPHSLCVSLFPPSHVFHPSPGLIHSTVSCLKQRDRKTGMHSARKQLIGGS